MNGLPDQAYAAALAGLDRMTVARLGVLLAHLTPAEAYAVAAGQMQPCGLVARLFDADGLAAAWRASAAQRAPSAAAS